MPFQAVFRRYEIKYIITRAQRDALTKFIAPRMAQDKYGRTCIRNIYYDTDTCLLARRSEEKPVYKEKLRVRSYGAASEDSQVFVELKKKYDSVVYKRRMALSEREAEEWLIQGGSPRQHSQIEGEIEYFRQFYETLRPRVFLSYERDAFYDMNDKGFRLTLDDMILARTDRLSLREETGGVPLLDSGVFLLELKTAGAIPLWFTAFLTENRIYKTSFSKYGAAYRKLLFPGREKTSDLSEKITNELPSDTRKPEFIR